MVSSTFYATPEELFELRKLLTGLTDDFKGRWANPDLHPEGSRPVRLFATLGIDPADPDDPADPADPDDSTGTSGSTGANGSEPQA